MGLWFGVNFYLRISKIKYFWGKGKDSKFIRLLMGTCWGGWLGFLVVNVGKITAQAQVVTRPEFVRQAADPAVQFGGRWLPDITDIQPVPIILFKIRSHHPIPYEIHTKHVRPLPVRGHPWLKIRVSVIIDQIPITKLTITGRILPSRLLTVRVRTPQPKVSQKVIDALLELRSGIVTSDLTLFINP